MALDWSSTTPRYTTLWKVVILAQLFGMIPPIKKKPIGSFVRFDLAVMKRSVADVSRQEENML